MTGTLNKFHREIFHRNVSYSIRIFIGIPVKIKRDWWGGGSWTVVIDWWRSRLCGVARNGKTWITVLPLPVPITDRLWQLVNRKWTRHPLRFPAIFGVGHGKLRATLLVLFLAEWPDPFLHFENLFCQRWDQRGRRAACAFASHAHFREEEYRVPVVPFLSRPPLSPHLLHRDTDLSKRLTETWDVTRIPVQPLSVLVALMGNANNPRENLARFHGNKPS